LRRHSNTNTGRLWLAGWSADRSPQVWRRPRFAEMGIFGFPLIPSERSPAVRSKKNVAVRRRGGIHSYFCVAVLDEQTTSQEKETTGHHLSVLCAETETVHHLFSSVCGCPTDLGRTS
jgi:hypothetical protein